jgi:diketogulonate reductase-like aldo/keto reductase
MEINIASTVTLNNGVEMPLLGLGVYQARTGREAENAVLWALEAGYRLIDTAMMYGNEDSVGKAIRKSGIPREEVFVTTKLWNTDHGYDRTLAACDTSLRNLGMDTVDLYLIHWPVHELSTETWMAMETLLKQGKARAIGVSNYAIHHLEELLSSANVVPAVNQVEFSPYLYQKDLLGYCNTHSIRLEAYSPLTRGRRLKEPNLVAIARKYGKTPAQVLIRWALQHEIVVIPKSVKRERIRENAAVFDFEIAPEDMARLDAFGQEAG